MPEKAKEYIDQSMSTVKSTVNSLPHAFYSAEKPDSKAKIQQAIDSLNSAYQQLSQYHD